MTVVKPILFSGPMVRALLDGRETMTRRVVKPQPEPWRDFYLEGGCQQADWRFETGYQTDDGKRYRFGLWMHCGFHESRFQPLPHAPGDLLYVREAHYLTDDGDEQCVVYAVDEADVANHIARIDRTRTAHGLSEMWAKPHLRRRPPMHMPRWASRITLRVTDVRVERVQEISEADAQAEGCDDGGLCVPVFHRLWNSLNAKRGYDWQSNPWVTATTFEVIRENVDSITAPTRSAGE